MFQSQWERLNMLEGENIAIVYMNKKMGKGRIQHRWMDWPLIPVATIDTKKGGK